MEGKNLSKTYWLLFDTDCRIQACVMVLNYKKGRKEIPIPPLPFIKELT